MNNSTDMYCANCRHPLGGLPAGQCPKCSKSFDPGDDKTFVTTLHQMRCYHTIIGLTIMLIAVIWNMMSMGPAMFVDLPSLIWIVLILVGGLWVSFGPGAVVRAMLAGLRPRLHWDRDTLTSHLTVFARAYQLSWGAGLIGAMFGVVATLMSMDSPDRIGPGMAISLLSTLYGAVLAEFVFSPMQQAIASRAAMHPSFLPLLLIPRRSILGVAMSVVMVIMVLILILFLANP
ncbi:MAG: MotA/TolQ/ExbB proton channel family protein [Phycisphaeraceae bacterium]|nr:MotA/TolQ/ExbB proton channel family protein [Phycisphaeraceae bacterium]